MPKRSRVFVDTSALLAGLNSPTGAAGTILAACFAHELIPVISSQIIEETERNIEEKFPRLQVPWASFLLIPPEVAPDPSIKEVRKAYEILSTSDAPILAAAIKAQPDACITWDRHFLQPSVKKVVSFPIFLPQEFLQQLRRKRTQ